MSLVEPVLPAPRDQVGPALTDPGTALPFANTLLEARASVPDQGASSPKPHVEAAAQSGKSMDRAESAWGSAPSTAHILIAGRFRVAVLAPHASPASADAPPAADPAPGLSPLGAPGLASHAGAEARGEPIVTASACLILRARDAKLGGAKCVLKAFPPVLRSDWEAEAGRAAKAQSDAVEARLAAARLSLTSAAAGSPAGLAAPGALAAGGPSPPVPPPGTSVAVAPAGPAAAATASAGPGGALGVTRSAAGNLTQAPVQPFPAPLSVFERFRREQAALEALAHEAYSDDIDDDVAGDDADGREVSRSRSRSRLQHSASFADSDSSELTGADEAAGSSPASCSASAAAAAEEDAARHANLAPGEEGGVPADVPLVSKVALALTVSAEVVAAAVPARWLEDHVAALRPTPDAAPPALADVLIPVLVMRRRERGLPLLGYIAGCIQEAVAAAMAVYDSSGAGNSGSGSSSVGAGAVAPSASPASPAPSPSILALQTIVLPSTSPYVARVRESMHRLLVAVGALHDKGMVWGGMTVDAFSAIRVADVRNDPAYLLSRPPSYVAMTSTSTSAATPEGQQRRVPAVIPSLVSQASASAASASAASGPSDGRGSLSVTRAGGAAGDSPKSPLLAGDGLPSRSPAVAARSVSSSGAADASPPESKLEQGQQQQHQQPRGGALAAPVVIAPRVGKTGASPLGMVRGLSSASAASPAPAPPGRFSPAVASTASPPVDLFRLSIEGPPPVVAPASLLGGSGGSSGVGTAASNLSSAGSLGSYGDALAPLPSVPPRGLCDAVPLARFRAPFIASLETATHFGAPIAPLPVPVPAASCKPAVVTADPDPATSSARSSGRSRHLSRKAPAYSLAFAPSELLMPPEYFVAKRAGTALLAHVSVDLWSLGALLLLLCSRTARFMVMGDCEQTNWMPPCARVLEAINDDAAQAEVNAISQLSLSAIRALLHPQPLRRIPLESLRDSKFGQSDLETRIEKELEMAGLSSPVILGAAASVGPSAAGAAAAPTPPGTVRAISPAPPPLRTTSVPSPPGTPLLNSRPGSVADAAGAEAKAGPGALLTAGPSATSAAEPSRMGHEYSRSNVSSQRRYCRSRSVGRAHQMTISLHATMDAISSSSSVPFPRGILMVQEKTGWLKDTYRVHLLCDGLWALPCIGALREHTTTPSSRAHAGFRLKLSSKMQRKVAPAAAASLKVISMVAQLIGIVSPPGTKHLIPKALGYALGSVAGEVLVGLVGRDMDYRKFTKPIHAALAMGDKKKQAALNAPAAPRPPSPPAVEAAGGGGAGGASPATPGSPASDAPSTGETEGKLVYDEQEQADMSTAFETLAAAISADFAPGSSRATEANGGAWDGIKEAAGLVRVRYRRQRDDPERVIFMCPERAAVAVQYYPDHFQSVSS